jgi:hypothetical protein
LIGSKLVNVKRNQLSIRIINVIFLLCFISSIIVAQRTNLDTLNIDQLNVYKDKAAKLRNAGMIVTFTGVGIAAAGWISSAIWAGNFAGESGEGFITLVPAGIGTAIGIPAAIIGIPLWAIGGNRKVRAEIALQRYKTAPETSMSLGVGIILRF